MARGECDTCKNYHEGLCRKDPPEPLIVMGPGTRGSYEYTWRCPPVPADWSCSHWDALVKEDVFDLEAFSNCVISEMGAETCELVAEGSLVEGVITGLPYEHLNMVMCSLGAVYSRVDVSCEAVAVDEHRGPTR